MADMFFNVKGETHHLFIEPIDEKPGDVTVWEAVVDNTSWTYFESGLDPDGSPAELWELIELGIQSYLDYKNDDSLTQNLWEG